MMNSILDSKWKYDDAEASRKPGYLAAKFAKERKRQAEERAKLKSDATVVKIKVAETNGGK
jgi:hypothetical protein